MPLVINPLFVGLIGLTSIFIFAAGMLSLNYYRQSENESRDSRMIYSSFVGFALGLAPLLIISSGLLTKYLPWTLVPKLFFGVCAFMCLLTWILCSVLLSDLNTDEKASASDKLFAWVVLGVTLVFSIAFGYMAYTGGKIGTYNFCTVFEGGNTSPMMSPMMTSPMMTTPMMTSPMMTTPMMTQPINTMSPIIANTFGKRRRR